MHAFYGQGVTRHLKKTSHAHQQGTSQKSTNGTHSPYHQPSPLTGKINALMLLYHLNPSQQLATKEQDVRPPTNGRNDVGLESNDCIDDCIYAPAARDAGRNDPNSYHLVGQSSPAPPCPSWRAAATDTDAHGHACHAYNAAHAGATYAPPPSSPGVDVAPSTGRWSGPRRGRHRKTARVAPL
ncbi:hypothetical protein Pelo_5938 [Pelomyxa schiedti]|nr:hypothetical protein Pelo_5938 [Pelomyxa schiedti]